MLFTDVFPGVALMNTAEAAPAQVDASIGSVSSVVEPELIPLIEVGTVRTKNRILQSVWIASNAVNYIGKDDP